MLRKKLTAALLSFLFGILQGYQSVSQLQGVTDGCKREWQGKSPAAAEPEKGKKEAAAP